MMKCMLPTGGRGGERDLVVHVDLKSTGRAVHTDLAMNMGNLAMAGERVMQQ